jgi:hypothetical protein
MTKPYISISFFFDKNFNELIISFIIPLLNKCFHSKIVLVQKKGAPAFQTFELLFPVNSMAVKLSTTIGFLYQNKTCRFQISIYDGQKKH